MLGWAMPGSFPLTALPVLLAFLLGAAIGAEREWRRHPGGLRSCGTGRAWPPPRIMRPARAEGQLRPALLWPG